MKKSGKTDDVLKRQEMKNSISLQFRTLFYLAIDAFLMYNEWCRNMQPHKPLLTPLLNLP